MSDYRFMLESHLTAEQNLAVNAVQEAANEAGIGIFLTGGAMRDMLGGFPIRDLDFTVEGNPSKIVKVLEKKVEIRVVAGDDHRKIVHLMFPGAVRASISMARTEKYPKPASKPKVQPATIHEDLRGRDFTINAIALSLNKASLGLLLDPTNGQADLERKELRIGSNYTLYDDPSRVLRMLRLKVRMNLTIEERTQSQYQNVREAGLLDSMDKEILSAELRQIAEEPNPGEVLATLDREGLVKLFSPSLTGAKVNEAGFQKLLKARQQVPFGIDFPVDHFALFLFFLFEKLTPKERAELVKQTGLEKSDLKQYEKLEGLSKKLERSMKSAKLNRPSGVYQALFGQPGEQLLFILSRSAERLVIDRIKNYLQKYIVTAFEITDAEVISELGAVAAAAKPGTPKFTKLRDQVIAKRLDARPKKVVVDIPVQPPTPPPIVSRVRY